MDSYQDVLNECLLVAVDMALDEAKKTPLMLGVTVGHIELSKYGAGTGELIAVTGDTATVRRLDGNIDWPIKGMVDVNRVDFFMKENVKNAVKILQTLQAIDELLGGGIDAANDILRPGLNPDDPTPGCDCEHCRTFTPEQHEDARRRLEACSMTSESQQGGGGGSVKAAGVGSEGGSLKDFDFSDPYLPRPKRVQ